MEELSMAQKQDWDRAGNPTHSAAKDKGALYVHKQLW